MKTKYPKLADGGQVTLEKGDEFRFQCCDCGLVHSIYHEIKGNELTLEFYRNRRATGQIRRHHFNGGPRIP